MHMALLWFVFLWLYELFCMDVSDISFMTTALALGQLYDRHNICIVILVNMGNVK